MSGNRVPTLLIGLGGLGSQIVKKTYKQMTDYDKNYVSFLCFDTNVHDLEEIEKEGIPFVQTSTNAIVGNYLKKNTDALEWFPSNSFLLSKPMSDGAGQIRAVSRLASEASEVAGDFSPVKAAIDKINRISGDQIRKNVKVMIVCSICGGTGAGMAIQIPFYIRELLQKEANIGRVLIRGLFVGPDIVEDRQKDGYSKDAVYVNAYACIKELNAFYGAQVKPQNQVLFNIPHYTKEEYDITAPEDERKANPIPYDFTFILERNNAYGQVMDSMDDYLELASDIVKLQLFTPLSGRMYSIEDNKIIGLMAKHGMNRYCGSGLARAVYPYEDIIKYIACRWSSDFIKNFWYKIDESFGGAQGQSRKQRNLDPSVVLLKLKDHYITQFEELTKDPSSTAQFKSLRAECVHVIKNDDDKTTKMIDKADWYVKAVEDYIFACSDSKDILAYSEACKPSESEMRLDSGTDTEMNRVMNAISSYEEAIGSLINNQSIVAADNIVPSELAGRSFLNKEYSLIALIQDLHPLSARYLMYKIRDRFSELLKEYKSKSDGRRFDVISSHDFDESTEEIDDPRQALEKRRPKNSLYHYFPFMGKDFLEIVDEFIVAANEQRREWDSFRQERLAERVYREVLRRIDALITLYEKMFSEIHARLDELDNEARIIENKHNIDEELTTHYVYASSEMKKKAYAKFCRNSFLDEQEQPPEALKALFEKIYKEFENTEKRNQTEKTDSDEVQFVTDMKHVFKDSILKNLNAVVRNAGNSDINIGIIRAMEAEIQEKRPENKKRDEHGNLIKVSIEELRTEIGTILIRSQPFISYDLDGTPETAIYWGVNPYNLPKDINNEEEIDKSYRDELFTMTSQTSSSEVIDDVEFSINELICYQAIYGLEAKNLHKFNRESRAHMCYKTRINEISSSIFVQSYTSYGKSIIHPHLDKRWHQPAYMPALFREDEEKENQVAMEAFLISVTRGICFLAKNDADNERWHFYGGGISPIYEIKISKKPINTDYFAMYTSLGYNSKMVEEIEKYAALGLKQAKESNNYDVLSHPMMKSLIQNRDALSNENSNILNVFDLIYRLYLDSGSDKNLLPSILAVLSNYIYKYCLAIQSDVEIAISNYEKVTNEIYKHSKLSLAAENDQVAKLFSNVCKSENIPSLK